MITALFGPSLAGKTTIARCLSDELALPLRSCGEEVRCAARSLGRDLSQLSDDTHHKIDVETIKWANHKQTCIVEGRFLNCVLSPLAPNVLLVRLEATESDRILRWSKDRGLEVGVNQLREVDEVDASFRSRMYADLDPLKASLILNTSELSVEQCVHQIRQTLGNAPKARG